MDTLRPDLAEVQAGPDAARVEVVVLAHARIPGHPRPDAPEVWRLPLADALRRDWPTDAHLAAYTSPTPYRLTRRSVEECGVQAAMVAMVHDVDDPVAHAEHTPARAKWRADLAPRIAALLTATGGLAYYTRGGARLVHLLATPVAIASPEDMTAWRATYHTGLCYLAARYGIAADPACADWTRLYRLPHATRDRRRGPERLEIIGDPGAIGVWPDVGDLARQAAAGLHATPGPDRPAVLANLAGGALTLADLAARAAPADETAPPAEAPAPRRTDRSGSRTDADGAWARAALAAECDRVACAPAGTRHDELFRAAAALGEIVGAGYLDRAEVAAALEAAVLAGPCRSLAAARRTIADGIERGARSPRGPRRDVGRAVDPVPSIDEARPRPDAVMVPLSGEDGIGERLAGEIRAWIASANPDEVLVLRTPGGSGKSRAALGVLGGYMGRRLGYSAHSHRLLDPAEDAGAWRWCGPGASLPIEGTGTGSDADDEEKRVPVCARSAELERAGSPSWWSAVVCPSCEHADGCRARERPTASAHVVAATHGAVGVPGIRDALGAIAWILDEDPPATRTVAVDDAVLTADTSTRWRELAAGLRVAAEAASRDAHAADGAARATGRRAKRSAADRDRARAAELRARAEVLARAARAYPPAAMAMRRVLGCAASLARAVGGYESSWAGDRLGEILDAETVEALAALGEGDIPLPTCGEVAAGTWAPPEFVEVAAALVRGVRGEALDGEHAAITCRTGHLARAGVTIRIDLPPGPVLVLDGTADAASIEARAGGRNVRVVGLDVAPADRDAVLRLRRATSAWSRRACRVRGWAESASRALRLVALAADASRPHLGRPAERVGVLTHAPLARALARLPEAHGWTVGYYGMDDRGVNRYRSVDLLVVLGDPVPHVGDAGRQAAALGLDPSDWLAVTTSATVEQSTWRARSLRRAERHAVAVIGRAIPPGWDGLPVVDLVDSHDPMPIVAPLVEEIRAAVERDGVAAWTAPEFVAPLKQLLGGAHIGGATNSAEAHADRRLRHRARPILTAAGLIERPVPRDMLAPGRRGRPPTYWAAADLPAAESDGRLRILAAEDGIRQPTGGRAHAAADVPRGPHLARIADLEAWPRDAVLAPGANPESLRLRLRILAGPLRDVEVSAWSRLRGRTRHRIRAVYHAAGLAPPRTGRTDAEDLVGRLVAVEIERGARGYLDVLAIRTPADVPGLESWVAVDAADSGEREAIQGLERDEETRAAWRARLAEWAAHARTRPRPGSWTEELDARRARHERTRREDVPPDPALGRAG